MNPQLPAKVLLDTIISNLPTDYNISAIVNTAAKEDEPRASGGSCDVTLGEFAWNVLERNHGLWGRWRGVRTGNEDSMRPISIKIAIKRARAHTLYNLPEDKREKFITVRLHYVNLLDSLSRFPHVQSRYFVEVRQRDWNLGKIGPRQYFASPWLCGRT